MLEKSGNPPLEFNTQTKCNYNITSEFSPSQYQPVIKYSYICI